MESVVELAEQVKRGERSARETVEDSLQRIARHAEALGAFIHVDADLAHRCADAVDAAIARGEDPGALAGVPFGVKDADMCAGLPLTHGSLLGKGKPVSERDSVHVARLRAAGAVPVGVTSAPEFGAISWTRSKAWGVARNPWNLDRTPGGSSGGSASAVAAGLVPFATAGDGGGSTRIPAGYSGLVGHKPSFGRIPREGATTSQTAVWGALVTQVRDAARHLDVASGPDDRDRTSLPASGVGYEQAIEELDVSGLRCMWSEDLGFAAVDPEVRALCGAAAEELIASARLTRAEAPLELDDLFQAWSNSSAIDIWLHLEKDDWPARADDFGSNIRQSLESTQRIKLPWYTKVLRSRTALEARVAEIFEAVDVLLTPTTAIPAHRAEGPPPAIIDGREVHPAMATPFTMLANLCWNPAVSVPAGLTSEGLPVGLQIMTRRHADDVALRLARIVEQERPWPLHAPGY
jgi:aspartyl-tRNA(Asn)/glutamyl-tRNA(Gln) amidotransferase subunit A